MLYTKSDQGFDKLADLFLKISVPQEYIDVMKEYLNTAQPRNNELLKKIDTVHITKEINIVIREDIDKALSKEIIKTNDKELSDRFVLLVFKLFKSSCHFFIPEKISRYIGDTPVFDPKEHFDNIAKLISEIIGDDAEAAAYAAYIDYAFDYQGGYFKLPHMKDTGTLRKAFGYLNGGKATPKYAKYYYCSAALLLCYLLEQEGDALSEDGKWAAETAEKLWEKSIPDDARSLMLCAAGEAAPYSEKMNARFKLEFPKYVNNIINDASSLPDRLLKLISFIETDDSRIIPEYISAIYFYCGRLPEMEKRIEQIAKDHPDRFKAALKIRSDNIQLTEDMSDILKRADPSYASVKDELLQRNRVRLADGIKNSVGDKEVIWRYVLGKAGLEEARTAIKGLCIGGSYGSGWAYYKTYGIDEYLARAVTVMALCDYSYGRNHRIERNTGFEIENHEKETFDMFRSCGLTLAEALDTLSRSIDDLYKKETAYSSAAEGAAAYPDELEVLDISSLSATARIIAVRAMGSDPERFKPNIIASASDSSKAVRAEIAAIFEKQDWHDDVAALLRSKKSATRELAVDIIGRQGKEAYESELKAALESEKTDKLKAAIGSLIGLSPEKTEGKESLEEQLARLAKTAKTSKLGFLFKDPLKPVHRKDGSEVSEDTVLSLVMCYAGMTAPARSRLADDIADALDQKDLEELAIEIFGRWLDNGAQAKHKQALYFCAIHGGIRMTRELMHCIKEWAEAMRGAIAAEAVKAMALSGSSEALMNVDNMSRKFKNKQVRSAAAEAMASAAVTLGITTEELADRIVPDLGFDSRLCRVFDYGKRQFSVYLKPSLELEIFSGDKQVKSLPKPGASDDKDTAEAAFAEFKEMKKQLKNVVTAQRSRLEYVLMCDRKWTSEKWKKLFVENAVMHCFAVGLIWGVYENGVLKDTFRYMDDGSFTTADGDEFDLQAGAEIGLVHPLELTQEQIDAWKEQLSDYELTQPFNQLGRKVFKPDEKELGYNFTVRFENIEVNSLALVSKMSKLGWYKGYAEDAGVFYFFYREDLKRRILNEDGSLTPEGMGSMLMHSGASAAAYDFEGEEVTLGKLVFFKAGNVPNYYDKEQKGWMKISEVDPRYYSETMLLLSTFEQADQ